MSLSPFSAGVLGAATLVSSPALWLGLVDRTIPLDVALTRYLVAVGLCWALLSVVAMLAFPAPGSMKLQTSLPDGAAEAGEAGEAFEDTAEGAELV